MLEAPRDVNVVKDVQTAPAWSGFNSLVTRNSTQLTCIGFPPMIPSSGKDKDAVYSCLKTLEKTFKYDLHQQHPVNTFDKDLYVVAKKFSGQFHLNWII